jgi:hypothetical protein
LLKLKGQIVGAGVQGVDVQDDFGLQDVDGLGSPFTQELVVGKIAHSFNLSQYRVSGQSLRSAGFIPEDDAWLTSGDLEMEVIDNISGATLELYTGCKAASHSRSYQKHVICGENANFRALKREVV